MFEWVGSVAGNSRVDIIDRRSGIERNASASCTSIELYNRGIDTDFAYIFSNISHNRAITSPIFLLLIRTSPKSTWWMVKKRDEFKRGVLSISCPLAPQWIREQFENCTYGHACNATGTIAGDLHIHGNDAYLDLDDVARNTCLIIFLRFTARVSPLLCARLRGITIHEVGM